MKEAVPTGELSDEHRKWVEWAPAGAIAIAHYCDPRPSHSAGIPSSCIGFNFQKEQDDSPVSAGVSGRQLLPDVQGSLIWINAALALRAILS
jgi:hypothetical protein